MSDPLDEAVEAAAFALYWGLRETWEREPEADRLQYRDGARRALDAALPLLHDAAADRVRADVLKLHQRCDNGHCSCGALRWPCSTARVVAAAADAPQPTETKE